MINFKAVVAYKRNCGFSWIGCRKWGCRFSATGHRRPLTRHAQRDFAQRIFLLIQPCRREQSKHRSLRTYSQAPRRGRGTIVRSDRLALPCQFPGAYNWSNGWRARSFLLTDPRSQPDGFSAPLTLPCPASLHSLSASILSRRLSPFDCSSITIITRTSSSADAP